MNKLADIDKNMVKSFLLKSNEVAKSDKQLKIAVKKYFASVKDIFQRGNIETTYNRPIAELVELFGRRAKEAK